MTFSTGTSEQHQRRKWAGPVHGHDPPLDRLAACPSGPQLSVVRERHAEYRCLVAGQENERGAPNSIKQLRDRVGVLTKSNLLKIA